MSNRGNVKTTNDEKLTAERIAEIQEVFSHFDKDLDGAVDLVELGAVIRSIGYNPSDGEVRQLVAGCDSDGKDVVEFAEFLSLVPRLRHQGDSESELLEAFSVFDRDGTGRIASADLRHVVTNLGEKLNEDEADDLIRFADETSQGEVDYRELIKILLAG